MPASTAADIERVVDVLYRAAIGDVPWSGLAAVLAAHAVVEVVPEGGAPLPSALAGGQTVGELLRIAEGGYALHILLPNAFVLADPLRRALALHAPMALRIHADRGRVVERLAVVQQIYDAIRLPLALLDRGGTVRVLNTLASQRWQGVNGIRVKAGRIEGTTQASHVRWSSALSQALSQDGEGLHVIRPAPTKIGEGNLLVLAQLRAHLGLLPGWWMLLEVDLEVRAPAEGRLQAELGLSRAQAAVIHRLAQGESPEEIAKATDVTIHTTRAHIKAAMKRAGVSREPALIAQVVDPTIAKIEKDAG